MMNEFKIVPSAMDIRKAIKQRDVVKALALITLKSLSYIALLVCGVPRIWRKQN